MRPHPSPSRSRVASAAVIAASAALMAGCLPGDTRPIPERLNVSIEPGPALTAGGIDTVDGWRITLDRFLFAIGNIDFENDDAACNSYAEAHYDRLFDYVVAGREKVGTVYGLGTCRIEFRLRAPSFDVLLGPGTTKSDVEYMRTEATDRYAEDDPVSLLVVGVATKGDATKRVEWAFRRSYELTDCKSLDGKSGYLTTVKLTEGAMSDLRIEVRPEELFRASIDDAADLVFQPMADADADADGTVTLLELSKVPAPLVEGGEGGGGGAGGMSSLGPLDGGVYTPESYEALVYERLFPKILRIAGGGSCEADERGRR